VYPEREAVKAVHSDPAAHRTDAPRPGNRTTWASEPHSTASSFPSFLGKESYLLNPTRLFGDHLLVFYHLFFLLGERIALMLPPLGILPEAGGRVLLRLPPSRGSFGPLHGFSFRLAGLRSPTSSPFVPPLCRPGLLARWCSEFWEGGAFLYSPFAPAPREALHSLCSSRTSRLEPPR